MKSQEVPLPLYHTKQNAKTQGRYSSASQSTKPLSPQDACGAPRSASKYGPLTSPPPRLIVDLLKNHSRMSTTQVPAPTSIRHSDNVKN